MSVLGRSFSTRSFGSVRNDENKPPVDHLAKKQVVRRAVTPRNPTRTPLAAKEDNTARDAASAEAAKLKLKEKTDEEDAAEAQKVEAVATSMLAENGALDLAAMSQAALGDPEAVRAMLNSMISKSDARIPAKVLEQNKVLKEHMRKELRQRRVLVQASQRVQDTVRKELERKQEQIDAVKAKRDADAAEAARRCQEQGEEFVGKLAMEQQIRQSIIAEAERAKEDLEAEIGRRTREATQLSTKLGNVEGHLLKVTQELGETKGLLMAKTVLAESTAQEKKVLEIIFQTFQEQQGTTSSQQTQAITDLNLKIDNLSNQVETKTQEVVVKETLVIQNQDVNEQLRLQLQEAQQTIRDMHNAIQDLKGNIRVFCRVRPTTDAVPAIKLCDEIGQVSVCWNEEEHDFTFDKAFGVASTQQQVFDEVEGVVQSALDGYKVCIFAYGQTGSGKTYTMQGNPCEPEGWGIIPRTLHKILESAEAMRAKGWTWTLTASFMEVYNESFRDLLAGPDSPSGTHTIVHDEAYGSSVTNMTTADIQSLDQVNRLMARAAKARSVGNTDMNSESSRSHAIFALYLLGVNKEHNAEMNGALHLVDLAGSERLDKSGATGTRLRETQNINKSLSSLADVFAAKAEEGRTHIPFRNSKLTHFMEPCLSGNGKTIMVLNAGPEQDHSHESLCSLRFAKQVAQCTTGGKPQRFVTSSSSSTGNTQPRPQTPTSRPPTPTQGRSARAFR